MQQGVMMSQASNHCSWLAGRGSQAQHVPHFPDCERYNRVWVLVSLGLPLHTTRQKSTLGAYSFLAEGKLPIPPPRYCGEPVDLHARGSVWLSRAPSEFPYLGGCNRHTAVCACPLEQHRNDPIVRRWARVHGL